MMLERFKAFPFAGVQIGAAEPDLDQEARIWRFF
jgi:hypothetical protein